jgi:hypothetical protein
MCMYLEEEFDSAFVTDYEVINQQLNIFEFLWVFLGCFSTDRLSVSDCQLSTLTVFGGLILYILIILLFF